MVRIPQHRSVPLVVRRRGRPEFRVKTNTIYRIWSESLLRFLYIYSDVRPEERTPSYAGSSSVMDFLLRDDGVAVEVKATRLGRSEPPGFPGHDRTYYEANKAIVDQAVETALFL